MQKKRRFTSPSALEPLENRQLLSHAVLTAVHLPAKATTTQIQPTVELQPTYEVLAAANSLSPLQTAGPEGYTPAEIRTAYGLNQVSFGGVSGDGSGQTIAIIDAYNDPTIQADLQGFDAAFGLANPTLTVVSQTGSGTLPPVDPAGKGNDNFEGEEALDVEWAHAMAPGAAIMLVEANNASPSNLFAAVNFARQQPGVSVVSMSFGGNETSSETQYDSIFTTPSGHNGVTFVASTGDEGEPGGYPAFSPNVVATGGTSLSINSLGNYQSETGWSGSGGGISRVESQPSYQNGIVTQSTTFRATPDVAFDADPSTGVAVYDSYNNGTSTPWEILGGTSVAAPSWAGIFAVADQGRAAAGEATLDSRTGTLPLLYSAPASDFHDITTGNNGFGASSGYDLVTGRGSPEANLLIPYLVTGATVTPPTNTGPTLTSILPSAPTVVEGDSLTLTAEGVSDSGASGVAVTFYEETNGIAGLQTGTGGDTAFTPVTDGSNAIQLDTSGSVGTFTFYAQVTDSSGGATPTGESAPSITVTVVAPSSAGPTIASISATPDPVVSGDALTLSASGISDPGSTVRRVYFYEETNGIPGLQTGPGGDFAFRPATSASGYSVQLDTSGVTGSFTFYGLAEDAAGNVSQEGASAPSATADVVVDLVPDAPTDLTAAAPSTTEVDLAFSETDSGQTGFTIQRALNAGFTSFTQLFTITRPDALTYTDTGLAPNTHYFYRVEAFNLAGDSGFSNVAEILTPAAGTRLAIAQQPPATENAGDASHAIVVDILSAQGAVATDDNSDVTLTAVGGPSGSALSGTTTVQAVNGVAVFNDVALTDAGRYKLVATDGTLTSAHTIAFTVDPDTASARLTLVSTPAPVTVGKAMTPVVVDIKDQYGNVIRGDTKIGVTILTGPAGAALKGSTSVRAANGIATLRNLTLSEAGSYTLQLSDAQIPGAAPISFSETVLPGTTAIAAPLHSASHVYGKAIALSARLKSTAPARIAFTGTATVTDANGDVLATGNVTSSGAVKFTLLNIAAGLHTCTINYPGDASHTADQSPAFSIDIKPAATTTQLASSASPAVAGQSVVLTATVASAIAPHSARTGAVTFKDGATTLGTAALDANSTAAFPIPSLAAGPHTFTAAYSGDGNFAASVSSPHRMIVA